MSITTCFSRFCCRLISAFKSLSQQPSRLLPRANLDPHNLQSPGDTHHDQLLRHYAILRTHVEAQIAEINQLHRIRNLQDSLRELHDAARELDDIVRELEQDATWQSLGENGGGRRGALRAAKSTVVALRNIKIKSEEETLVCSVCQSEVDVGECAKELPCGHGYHAPCITTWLACRNTCPLCRFELPTIVLN